MPLSKYKKKYNGKQECAEFILGRFRIHFTAFKQVQRTMKTLDGVTVEIRFNKIQIFILSG